VFVLQKMPHIINNETTCGYPICLQYAQTFKLDSYRLSLEPKSNGFDHSQAETATTSVGTWKAVKKSLQSAGNPANLRGKALGGMHWFCLSCVEKLKAREEVDDKCSTISLTLAVVLAQISKYIFPECRENAAGGKTYKLSSPQTYAVEKWKAAILFLEFFAEQWQDQRRGKPLQGYWLGPEVGQRCLRRTRKQAPVRL